MSGGGEMSGTDTTLAAAALAIALVALCTTIGQLLQQYFATADGYRRCQKSVMGEYARKTRLQWRWREFRFETLYTTPEIFLAGNGAPSRIGQVVLTGSKASREESMVPAISIDPTSNNLQASIQRGKGDLKLKNLASLDWKYQDESACWLPFLHWLQETSQTYWDHRVLNASHPIDCPPPGLQLPAIIFREKSWDFQAPDVVRPLAKTTLSDIAVFARRMGMRWKDFRPSDGILRAEGHSHVITSTFVRSLGIVLQYAYTGHSQRLHMAEVNLGRELDRSTEESLKRRFITGSLIAEQEEIYIPCSRADRLGCGVIRSDVLLGLPDFTVSTQPEIVTALGILDHTGISSLALTQILKESPGFRFRVADLVALAAPPAHYRGSRLVQVPAPSDNVRGVTASSVGRRAFRMSLEEYISVHKGDVGPRTKQALHICHKIGSQYAAWDHVDDYSTQDEQWIVTRDPDYLDLVLDHINSLNVLLHSWEKQHSFRYINMLGIHIRVAMFAEDGETSLLRSSGSDYKTDVEGYFRVLPMIVEEMAKTGFSDEQMIVDAWVTMMLRAMCWGACHFFVPGERVPIQYYGSQLPVYIG